MSHYVAEEALKNYGLISAKLREAGLPAPQVFSRSSNGHEYAMVEKVDIDFTLQELLSGKKPRDSKLREKYLLEVVHADELVKKAVTQTNVSDLHTGNIVYSQAKGGWILLDFNSSRYKSPEVRYNAYEYSKQAAIEAYGQGIRGDSYCRILESLGF